MKQESFRNRRKEEKATVRSATPAIPADFSAAVKDIKLAILQARGKAARASNAEALKLYFFVGGYISKKTRNAKWGSGAIDALSQQLQVELPGLRGFSPASIKYMRIFFDEWAKWFEIRHLPSDESRRNESSETSLVPIRHLASDELHEEQISAFFSIGFTHHREILNKCASYDERWHYIRACARGQWTVEELHAHLRADECRHVGELPNNFGETLSPMALATRAVRSFRDEYLLDFVNLDNADALRDQDVDERVLSKALVADVEKTILALGGSDFCFMGREKRLIVEGEEIFIDLLFYHRGLRSMVAVELKMGKFRAAYLGQLSLYLSALDKFEKKPDENPSIGLLLCEEMNKPFVQLAVQDVSKPIGIATYRTLRSIPTPYKALAPVIDGVRRVMAQGRKDSDSA